MPAAIPSSDEMPIGGVVKFRAPMSSDEAQERFVVIEHRGERVLVEFVCDMAIRPQSVYLADDLEPA
jgi:hypothetical protein